MTVVGSKIYNFVETFDKDSRQKYFRRKHCWIHQYVSVFSKELPRRSIKREKSQAAKWNLWYEMRCIFMWMSLKYHVCIYDLGIWNCASLQGCGTSSSHPAASARSDLVVWSAGPSLCGSCLYLHRPQCLSGKDVVLPSSTSYIKPKTVSHLSHLFTT